MIDPLLTPPSPRELLDAARVQRRKRPEPARTSKIVTAGASATALFTMVAAMGWQSGTGSANSGNATVSAGTTTVAVPVTPSPTLSTVPPVEPSAATVPAAAVPVLVPEADDAPAPTIVVPRAVPVATLPAQKTVTHKSHTTTKTSG